MLNIYKKINKTRNNMYGIKEITNAKDLNRPFLLCISNNDTDKSIFGIIRDGAHAARMHTTQECANKFDLEKTPIDFIGVRFSDYETAANDLVEYLLYPHIVAHGFSKNTMFKQARKINLYTFDYGSSIYLNAEKILFERLKKENITEEEIVYILKQISLVSTGSSEDLSNTYATTISFVDLKDELIRPDDSDEFIKVLEEQHQESMYNYWDDNNSMIFRFIGTGEHSPKYYLLDECPAKPAISAMVSNFLLNSFLNCDVPQEAAINRDFCIDSLYLYGTNNMPRRMTLKNLDEHINYPGAIKYTDEEAYLRNEVDDCYKLINEADKIIDTYEEQMDEMKNAINLLISKIKDNCDDDTFDKILVEAGIRPPKEKKTTKKTTKKSTKNNKKVN